MLTALGKYDLLTLALADTWPEEKQAEMVLKFTNALSGFLGQELSSYFDESSEKELKNLLNDPKITPEKVQEFYKSKVPNFEAKIDDLILRFKKMFLLGVYQKKVEELKEVVASLGKTPVADNEARRVLLESKENEYLDWQQVLSSAQNDDWDKTSQVLSTISH